MVYKNKNPIHLYKKFNILVPESDFLLETKMDGARENVEVMCAVQNVFPQPVLSVM